MKKWFGAAGICLNDKNEILMVKQGTPEEKKIWSIPSGEKEVDESFEACCVREIKEEAGYDVHIIKSLFVKEEVIGEYEVHVHYFQVMVYDGSLKIQDPDNLIYEVSWKAYHEIEDLELSYPEDRKILLDFIKEKSA